MLMLALLICLLMGSTALAEETQALYNPDVPAPHPEAHEPTGDEYFADAVFVGDSMMEAIEMMGEIPTANYVCKVGLGPATVGVRQFRVRGQDQQLNVYEMIATYEPKKIYILLGGNGLDWNSYTVVLENYEIMIDNMIEMFPDALIYVVAVPPGSRSAMAERDIPVGRFTEFNRELLSMAERRGLYYLDLYSIIADANGYLPAEYDSGDGYHMTKTGYSLFNDMVRRHTVAYPD